MSEPLPPEVVIALLRKLRGKPLSIEDQDALYTELAVGPDQWLAEAMCRVFGDSLKIPSTGRKEWRELCSQLDAALVDMVLQYAADENRRDMEDMMIAVFR